MLVLVLVPQAASLREAWLLLKPMPARMQGRGGQGPRRVSAGHSHQLHLVRHDMQARLMPPPAPRARLGARCARLAVAGARARD